MNEREFLGFVVEQYNRAFETNDSIYSRAGLILTAQVVFGGALYSIARHDLLELALQRVDAFVYHAASLTSLGFLLAAAVHLFRAILPRDYPKIVDLSGWRKWREDLRSHLEQEPKTAESDQSTSHEAKCAEAMRDRLIEATDKAVRLNQQRLQHIQKSIRYTAKAVFAMAVAALAAFALAAQGF